MKSRSVGFAAETTHGRGGLSRRGMRHLITCLVMAVPSAGWAQANAPAPLPAPTPAGTPNTNVATSVSKTGAVDANAMLAEARQATKEKRWDESDALMKKLTANYPNMVLAWMELGLAQLGLKHYDHAENSFKIALGIDPGSQAAAHDGDFYQKVDAPGVVAPGATRGSMIGGMRTNAGNRTPDVLGTAYASLGEIYIQQKRFPEAKEAFDTAVKDYPVEAAQYRRNETILFFKAGDSDAQLAAADQAIALNPTRAMLYYFKGQALVSKASVDSSGKIQLPLECSEAYQKYLELDPNGPYSADAKGVLAAAGVPIKPGKK